MGWLAPRVAHRAKAQRSASFWRKGATVCLFYLVGLRGLSLIHSRVPPPAQERFAVCPRSHGRAVALRRPSALRPVRPGLLYDLTRKKRRFSRGNRPSKCADGHEFGRTLDPACTIDIRACPTPASGPTRGAHSPTPNA